MSSIYVLEPPTNGRVVLHTTVGNIDVELWSKEAPKACRNFVQHCLEGYYDGTIFHRVVKDFIVQGGDPTGTGEGGESAYGATFGLEIHSRLRFIRRGLVGMACLQPGQNASQFFFTLGATPELEKHNTIFGQVVGSSLFNMLRLAECETDQQERPLHPQRVLNVQVADNPFADLTPREEVVLELRRRRQEEQQQLQEAEAQPRRHQRRQQKAPSEVKATKNFALLSFGDEAEEEEREISEQQQQRHKLLSSHDLLDDPRLSSHTADILPTESPEPESSSAAAATAAAAAALSANAAEGGGDDAGDVDDESRDARLARLKREVARLRRDLHKAGPVTSVASSTPVAATATATEVAAEKKAAEAAAPASSTSMRKRRRGGGVGDVDDAKAAREAETLRILAKFTAKLAASSSSSSAGDKGDKDPAGEQDQDRGDDREQEDGQQGGSSSEKDLLFSHVFLSDSKPAARRVIDASLGSAAEPERYDLHDPRNPMTKRRRKAAAAKASGGALRDEEFEDDV